MNSFNNSFNSFDNENNSFLSNTNKERQSFDIDDNLSDKSILESDIIKSQENKIKELKNELERTEKENKRILADNINELEEKLKKERNKNLELLDKIREYQLKSGEELQESFNSTFDKTPKKFSKYNSSFLSDTHYPINSRIYNQSQSFDNLKDSFNDMIDNIDNSLPKEDIPSFLLQFDELIRLKENNDLLLEECKNSSLFYAYINGITKVFPIEEVNENNEQIKKDLVFAIKQLKMLLANPNQIKKKINNIVSKNQCLIKRLQEVDQSIISILPPKESTPENQLKFIHNYLLELIKIQNNGMSEEIEVPQNIEPPEELLQHLSTLENLKNKIIEEKDNCMEIYSNFVKNSLDEQNMTLEDNKEKLDESLKEIQNKIKTTDSDPLQKSYEEKNKILSELSSKIPNINTILNDITNKNHDKESKVKEINDLKQQIIDLKRQLEDLENEKQNYLKNMKITDPESVHSLLQDLNNEIKHLNFIKEGGDPKKIIENLNNEVESKQNEIKKLEEEINQFNQRITSFRNTVNDLALNNNEYNELYHKRNEILKDFSDNDIDEDINKIKKLIDIKNDIAKSLDEKLSEKNKGEEEYDLQSRLFNLIDESTRITVYDKTQMKDRLLDLTGCAIFILENIDFDEEIKDEKIITKLKAEILRLNVENKKLLAFINYQLKYNEYKILIQERNKLINDKTRLELELASGGGNNENALIVSDNEYINRLKSSLEMLSGFEDERYQTLSDFYKTQYNIIGERLKNAQEKNELLRTDINNQTIDVTNLTKERDTLKNEIEISNKKIDKLNKKNEKLNEALKTLMKEQSK